MYIPTSEVDVFLCRSNVSETDQARQDHSHCAAKSGDEHQEPKESETCEYINLEPVQWERGNRKSNSLNL